MVLFKSFKNFLLSNKISGLSNSSANVGKLSVGKQSKLKSELSLFKLSLFSVLRSKFNSELEDIFLKISYSTVAEVVVLPSFVTFTSFISS